MDSFRAIRVPKSLHDKEEIKYEIADFLYHVMVLMAQKDVTWEDITEELANR